MDDYKDSVMIALLPMTTDWCRIELPHMTLVYAGEKPSLKPTAFNEMAKDACAIAMVANPVSCKVTGVEVFGDKDEDKVNVLRLRPSPELWGMRKLVEHWNASEYPFRPHATIGPVGPYTEENIPNYLAFDRIMVCWGEDYLTFWLKR